jgi:hypothetical protein
MGCWSKTKKFFLKTIVPEIGDILFNYAVGVVGDIERMAEEDPLWWSSTTKRRFAELSIRSRSRELGKKIPTKLINLTIEAALVALEHPDSPIPDEVATPGDIEEAKAEGDAITV